MFRMVMCCEPRPVLIGALGILTAHQMPCRAFVVRAVHLIADGIVVDEVGVRIPRASRGLVTLAIVVDEGIQDLRIRPRDIDADAARDARRRQAVRETRPRLAGIGRLEDAALVKSLARSSDR